MLLPSALLLLLAHPSLSVDSCQTPNGQDGDCKPINQCPSIFSLFRHPPLSDSTATFVRKSQCGVLGIYPKVCCPIGSPTPPEKPSNVSARSALLPELCGYSVQNKIFGGTVAELDEFPWMALLEYEVNGNRTFGCGGTLINKRYVLTARHCIKQYLVNVRLGEYDTRTDPDCVKNFFGKDCNDKAVNVGIEEKISYVGSGDIALLRLNQDVEFTDFVKPICLPISLEGLTDVGKKLIVAGWGLTEKNKTSEIKLKVSIPVKSLTDCEGALKSVFNLEVQLNDGHLCAGGEEGKDSCNGDSGGPLMGIKIDKQKNLQWYVMGIVSFGPTNPCGRKDKPAVYVRVSNYVDWIVKNLKP